MTLRGAELLRKELAQLKNERPNIAQAIAEARSHGDLSENAEYDAAREKQGLMEARIRDIEAKLANAQIVDPKTLHAEGRVVFGATVDVGARVVDVVVVGISLQTGTVMVVSAMGSVDGYCWSGPHWSTAVTRAVSVWPTASGTLKRVVNE